MGTEELECFWISSSTMSLGNWNPNISQDWPIWGKKYIFLNRQFVPICSSYPMGLKAILFSIYFRKKLSKLMWRVKYKNFSVKKRASVRLSHIAIYLCQTLNHSVIVYFVVFDKILKFPWTTPFLSYWTPFSKSSWNLFSQLASTGHSNKECYI